MLTAKFRRILGLLILMGCAGRGNRSVAKFNCNSQLTQIYRVLELNLIFAAIELVTFMVTPQVPLALFPKGVSFTPGGLGRRFFILLWVILLAPVRTSLEVWLSNRRHRCF